MYLGAMMLMLAVVCEGTILLSTVGIWEGFFQTLIYGNNR